MNAKLGKKSRKRLDLLGRQPLCIFCGGAAPASTIDHQPARSFFDAKQAPESYEFPACEPRNKKSRQHENALTTLVRFKGDGEQNGQREVDFAKAAKAMLLCALHYKHTGNILPADAEITVKWATNAGLPEFLTDEKGLHLGTHRETDA